MHSMILLGIELFQHFVALNALPELLVICICLIDRLGTQHDLSRHLVQVGVIGGNILIVKGGFTHGDLDQRTNIRNIGLIGNLDVLFNLSGFGTANWKPRF